jgi:hypothetical protein
MPNTFFSSMDFSSLFILSLKCPFSCWHGDEFCQQKDEECFQD